jgi:hypothetical protein
MEHFPPSGYQYLSPSVQQGPFMGSYHGRPADQERYQQVTGLNPDNIILDNLGMNYQQMEDVERNAVDSSQFLQGESTGWDEYYGDLTRNYQTLHQLWISWDIHRDRNRSNCNSNLNSHLLWNSWHTHKGRNHCNCNNNFCNSSRL